MRDAVEPTNTLLVATSAPGASARSLAARANSLPADIGPLATSAAARLQPALRGGEVLTDDRAPVEWLVDRSIVEYAARGGH
jgi:hypothetical protein